MEERQKDLVKYMELLLKMRENDIDVSDEIVIAKKNLFDEMKVENKGSKSPSRIKIVIFEDRSTDAFATADYYLDRFGGEKMSRSNSPYDFHMKLGNNIDLSIFVLTESNYEYMFESKLRGTRADYIFNNSKYDIPFGSIRATNNYKKV